MPCQFLTVPPCLSTTLPSKWRIQPLSLIRRKRKGDSKHPCWTPVTLGHLSWHGRCCGSGRKQTSQVLCSASVASAVSLGSSCGMLSHRRWSWCRGGTSTPVTVLWWYADWLSSQHMTCGIENLPAGRGASPGVHCLFHPLERIMFLRTAGHWQVVSAVSHISLLWWGSPPSTPPGFPHSSGISSLLRDFLSPPDLLD